MNTIINKKGNSGYAITGWNFSFSNTYLNRETSKYDANGTSCDLIRSEEIRESIHAITRPVTIHSCGKKQMKLFADDTAEIMRGSNFDPEMKIFATEQDAIDWFEAEWEAWMKADIIKDAERNIERYSEDGYYGQYKWCEDRRNQYIEALRRLKAGEIAPRITTYTEAKAEL